jgi:hypothetical protein
MFWLEILCACLLLYAPSLAQAPQKHEYGKQAELDREGNVYVSSDEGKLIKVAEQGHCSEIRVAPDDQTVACRVTQPAEYLGKPGQLDFYFKGGSKRSIAPGVPIREWHFWNDGQQVSVFSGPLNGPRRYALYDLATGNIVEQLQEPSEKRSLPQWAKDAPELDDESVPMSPALTEERAKWVAKVLRQIQGIQPGMRREDVLKVFTTEGGLSTRRQRTFVYPECPYIKVDVRFKAVSPDEKDGLNEDPKDIIESISRPYLAWSIMD